MIMKFIGWRKHVYHTENSAPRFEATFHGFEKCRDGKYRPVYTTRFGTGEVQLEIADDLETGMFSDYDCKAIEEVEVVGLF